MLGGFGGGQNLCGFFVVSGGFRWSRLFGDVRMMGEFGDLFLFICRVVG